MSVPALLFGNAVPCTVPVPVSSHPKLFEVMGAPANLSGIRYYWMGGNSAGAADLQSYASFGCGANADGSLTIYGVDAGGGKTATSAAGLIVAGVHRRIGMEYEQGVAIRGLIDGVVVCSVAVGTLVPITHVHVGQFGSTPDFEGTLLDPRAWSNLRTYAQMEPVNYRRLLGSETGLFRYYRTDEGSGTSLADETGGATATVTGATWTTITSPFLPPSAPLAFTAPVEDETVRGRYVVQWGASEHAGGEAVTYTLQIQQGASWTTIQAGLTSPEWQGVLALYEGEAGSRLRVRATSIDGDSEWTESDTFTIYRRLLVEPYEVGDIRVDRGRFVDKGNYAVDPCHGDFGGGAKGDGTTDDRAALADADTYAQSIGCALVLRPDKLFRVASALTIASPVCGRGGQIRPASGITVTLNGGVEELGTEIEDPSLGGTVDINRPTSPFTGQLHYDRDLLAPIWWNGSAWKNAAGTTV